MHEFYLGKQTIIKMTLVLLSLVLDSKSLCSNVNLNFSK